MDTVVKVSKAYADRGGDALDTVTRKKRLTPPVEAKITGDVEVRLIALACTKPPEGYERWSLRLLEKHVLLTEGIPALDHSSIGRVLKKTKLQPHLKEYWAIPPTANGEFVARLQDVLEVYALPYDPEVPVVAMDEKPYQLWITPGPASRRSPGAPARKTMSTPAREYVRSSCGVNRWPASAG